MSYLDFLARGGGAHRVTETTDRGFTIVPAVDDDAGFEAFQEVAREAVDRADDRYRALPHRNGDHSVVGWDSVYIEVVN